MHVAFAAITALGAAPSAAQSVQDVQVRAFRFYRAESKQTMVTAFLEVPYRVLTADNPGTNGNLRYSVVVQVTDAAGAKLHEASWPGQAKADLQAAGATKLEILDFAVAPGKYRIGVTVTDSVSGKQFTAAPMSRAGVALRCCRTCCSRRAYGWRPEVTRCPIPARCAGATPW